LAPGKAGKGAIKIEADDWPNNCDLPLVFGEGFLSWHLFGLRC